MAATVPIAEAGTDTRELAAAPGHGGRAGTVLGVLLGVAVAYAVFAHGATSNPSEARLQVGLAAISMFAAVLWLWPRPRRIEAPATAWAGLALLTAFAAWSGLSLGWTVSPSDTWTELNRAMSYALVTGLALAYGSWDGRALRRTVAGFLGIGGLAALYALGGKLAPGIHIGSLVNLDQTHIFPRLRAPLQYWNALGMLCVLGLMPALAVAAEARHELRVRVGGLVMTSLFALTLALTYSRGSIIALIFAVGVLMALNRAALRTLMYLGMAILAVVPAIVFALTANDLTGVFIPVADREGDGLLLAALTAGGLTVLGLAGRAVIAAEQRTAPNPLRSRRIAAALIALVVVAALGGVGAMAASDRGLSGTITHQWDTFRKPKDTSFVDPAHLVSSTSGNRWVWWSEALGAWSDHPLAGSGAGSFPVLHRRYRKNNLDVRQPHSVPFQHLAETGLVGVAMYVGALGLLLAAALAGVRRRRPGSERALAAGLFAATAAWTLHEFADWDWDIPGVTVPALALLGVLAARPGGERIAMAATGRARSALALAAVTLVLCNVAISSALPSWAETVSQNALERVGRDARSGDLRHAVQRAEFAAKLDPLSVEPLLAAAALEGRRGRLAAQRADLVRAVRRQPQNARVWISIASFEFTHGRLASGLQALKRARTLDPRNKTAPLLLSLQYELAVPPAASATATGTPLLTINPVPEPGTPEFEAFVAQQTAAQQAAAAAGAPATP